MIVLILTACPPGLRGQLTRWLLEVSPGVFVGHVSARVRQHIWERTCELAGSGRAILVHSARGEQRLAFLVHNHDWVPTDLDGLTLMLRPNPSAPLVADNGGEPKAPPPERWSIAARRRRFGREMEQRRRRAET